MNPRVLVQPADDGGSGHYRLIFPARALMTEGYDVVVDTHGIVPLWDREWHGSEPPPHVRVMGLAVKPDYDVVVWQRPARRWIADLIPHLQAVGVRVVVDVDDRFDAIPEANRAFAHYAPNLYRVLTVGNSRLPVEQAHPHHNWQWIDLACKLADVVTASTPALVDRYGYGHGRVLPNFVPNHYLWVEPEERRERTLGWTGSIETHPGDLEATGGAVPLALRGSEWGFHVIGTGVGVREALRLTEEPSNTGTWVHFTEYPFRMAEIAVGIVPLVPSRFNEAKSALKMAEFAAVGVPVVASPTPDNVRLNRAGVGWLASTPSQWRRRLRTLIASEQARVDLAGTGRTAMLGQTYERHAERWWDAWTAPVRSAVSA